jgi:cell division protein FtsI (penicillin-binding protein 3)
MRLRYARLVTTLQQKLVSVLAHDERDARTLSRQRLKLAFVVFAVIYGVIALRLAYFASLDTPTRPRRQQHASSSRPDIVDRNGYLLATDLRVASLYAEPRRILDVDETIEGLHQILPDLDFAQTYAKLKSDLGFVWLKRQLAIDQQRAIAALGIPAIGFRQEVQRYYPNGREFSHVIGLTNIDNQGISGLEKWIDDQGLTDQNMAGFGSSVDLKPIQLSLDARVQHVLHDELSLALARYKAAAAGGVILNAKTGEIIALVSLPDFDPNNPHDAFANDRLNRISASTAEMGSTIKTFTTAMAMEIGKASLTTMFDASQPIVVGRQRVHDPHSKGRPLSLEEVFLFSSNIGSAQEARLVGVEQHQAFLTRLGLLTRLNTELPEIARPVQPRRWSQATSITGAFGHGFATTPLQTAVGIAAILNHGRLIPPTFLPRTEAEASQLATIVVGEKTSQAMRYLYRLNGVKGSGRQANIPGFRVGGKTGTAEKVIDGRYAKDRNFNAFAAALPMDDPQIVMLVVIDDPKPEEAGKGITSAANAAPTAGAIIKRTALMLGIWPEPDEGKPIMVGEFQRGFVTLDDN